MTVPPQIGSDETSPRLQAVDRCILRAADPDGEGRRTYLTLYADRARAVAASLDAMAEAGYVMPLDGMPISIKDLLDVEGEVTRAAAQPLDDAPPAEADAPVVERLKQAGAVLIGRTNMTPFAYSAVGLNDHFGTPRNPADAARTPGGSSSGAAVSIAASMATAAIGSDTVGSVRVPAALCGVVGFKPTQARVPRDGAVPLSRSLDSIGPLATSVGDCARVFSVISAGRLRASRRSTVCGLRLALPNRYLLEGLDHTVSVALESARRRLSARGAIVREHDFEALAAPAASDLTRTIQSVEAFSWHRDLIARRGDDYEPRIRDRILAGRDITAARYVSALQRRRELIAVFAREMARFDALILPTVPIVAPTLAECEADESTVRQRLTRNCAPFNLLDACALTLPIQAAGELPVGLMIVTPGGGDDDVLDTANAIEADLRSRGDE